MINKQTARMENWIDCGSTLIGHIRNHARQADFHCDSLYQTSRVIHRDPENNTVETLNTIYTLGKPWSKDT